MRAWGCSRAKVSTSARRNPLPANAQAGGIGCDDRVAEAFRKSDMRWPAPMFPEYMIVKSSTVHPYRARIGLGASFGHGLRQSSIHNGMLAIFGDLRARYEEARAAANG